jgi:hypothetical protein
VIKHYDQEFNQVMSELIKIKKRRSLPLWANIAITIVVMAAVIALVLRYAQNEGDSNNASGDVPPGEGIATVTGQVDVLSLKHTFIYNDVRIALVQVQEAQSFSDDHKQSGAYTIRINVQTSNTTQQVVGIPYASLAHLILPDGTLVNPKLVSALSDQLPNNPQTGFFDYPLTKQMPISALKWRFDNLPIVSFGS